MQIKANGIMKHEVTVDVSDVLNNLKKRLGFADSHSNYTRTTHHDREGIYRIEDVSHHGSPIWEYTLLTDKEEDIKAFECINYLLEYLNEIQG